MTVQQLIDLLNKIEDKNKQVIIPVHTATKVYAVAYARPEQNRGYLSQNSTQVLINIWLPDNMHTVTKKTK